MADDGGTLPPVIAELQANADDFQATVDDVKGQLDSLDASDSDPNIGADTTDFDTKTDAAQSILDYLDADHADPSIGLDTSDFDAKAAGVEAELAAIGAEGEAAGAEIDDGFGDAPGAIDDLDLAMQQAGIDADSFGEAMYQGGINAQGLADAAENAGVPLEALVADMAAASAGGADLGGYLEGLGQGFFQVGEYAAIGGEDLDLFGGSLFNVEASAEAVTETLADTAGAFITAATAVNTLTQMLDDDELAIADLEEAFQSATSSGNSFSSVLSSIAGYAEEAGSSLASIGGTIALWGGIFVTLIPLVGAFIGELGALSSIAFVAFAGLGAFALGVVGALADTTSATTTAASSTSDALSGLTSGFTDLENKILPAIEAYGQALAPFVDPTLSAGLAAFKSFLTAIQPLGQGTALVLTSIFNQLNQDFQSSGFGQFVTWLTVSVGPALNTISGFFDNVSEAFAEMGENGGSFTSMIEQGIDSLGQDLKNFGNSNTFKDFVDWLKNNAPTVGGELETIGKDIGKVATDLAPFGLNLLKDLTKVMNLLARATTDLIQWDKDLKHWTDDAIADFRFLADVVQTVWSGMVNTLHSDWSGVANWVSSNVIQPIESFFSDIPGAVDGAWSDVVSGLHSAWSSVSSWVNSNVVQPIVSFFTGIPGDVNHVWSDVSNAIHTAWSAVANWVNSNLIQPIESFFTGLPGDVTKALSGLAGIIEKPFQDAWTTISGIVSHISSAINSIKNAGPSVGGVSLNPLHYAAEGGMVDRPTLLVAGEAGRELIVPEDKIPGGFGGGGVAPLPSVGVAAAGGGGTSVGEMHFHINGTNLSAPEIAQAVRTEFVRAGRAYGQRGGVLGNYAGSRR